MVLLIYSYMQNMYKKLNMFFLSFLFADRNELLYSHDVILFPKYNLEIMFSKISQLKILDITKAKSSILACTHVKFHNNSKTLYIVCRLYVQISKQYWKIILIHQKYTKLVKKIVFKSKKIGCYNISVCATNVLTCKANLYSFW